MCSSVLCGPKIQKSALLLGARTCANVPFGSQNMIKSPPINKKVQKCSLRSQNIPYSPLLGAKAVDKVTPLALIYAK